MTIRQSHVSGISAVWARRVFIATVLCFSALVYVSFRYGIQRGYVFEVIAISIDWAALIVGSIALAGMFNASGHDSLKN